MLLKAARSTDTDTGMDMTPMIDTVFNLLIFFLVAGSFQQMEREMHIALPAARTAGPISMALREIVVNVDAQGRMVVAGKSLDAPELDRMIRDAVAANPEQKVTVRGDRAVAYAHVVRVLDVCKGAGIRQPFLDTVLED
jgi:biopolymer transport protein ExbD